MPFGTLSTLDDLEHVNSTVEEFGEETLARRASEAFTVYNRAADEMFRDFAVVTSQNQLPYGVSGDFTVQELDQFGSPDVQKTTAGGSLGLPLRFFGNAIQWNRHFVLNSSVGQLATLLNRMASADLVNLTRQIRRALFTPTNNLAYQDALETKLVLQLRALLNADGMAIPPGPNLETFNPNTHTHFMAAATLTNAQLTALVDNVVEHGVDGGVVIYINRSQESTIRGLADFSAYQEAGIHLSDTDRYAIGAVLDVTNPTDRAIGRFAGAEVWVKPWVPSGYQLAFDTGNGADRALAVRTRTGSLSGAGGFGLLYENDLFPLRATAYGREFGVGVAVRHKAAINYIGASYVAPSL